jgi:hypothetical protein
LPLRRKQKQIVKKLERVELPESLEHAKGIAAQRGFSDAWAHKTWELKNGT